MNEKKDYIVFILDKNGKKQDKTSNIESIEFDEKLDIYEITFIGNPTTYCYRAGNVQVIENSLKEKHSTLVFDYLLRMAEFSELVNEKGQNLLVKNFEKSRFVDKNSVLAKYLNPDELTKINKKEYLEKESYIPIFPFGCNSSQLKAVKTAMENQISIIQGPPGTGKTQTILNIIANLLINDKTVLIVSNNNSATANVYEKLSSEKYGFGFLCATLGKNDNVEDFLNKQEKSYPAYLHDWKTESQEISMNDEINHLKKYFKANERISEIHSELSALQTEVQYLKKEEYKTYSNKKLLKKIKSQDLMNFLQKIQFKYAKKEKLGFFKKLKLKFKYKIGFFKFWNLDPEIVINTLKESFYLLKQKELEDELIFNEKLTQSFDPQIIYDKCLKSLRTTIYNRYSKNTKRTQFDNDEIFFHPDKFVKEYPIVMSTTFSSRSTIGNGKGFLYDYLIMDEASQVDVITGALALSCAKNAVIVGDKKQLSNVIKENKKKIIQELFDKTGLESGYNFLNNFLSSLEIVLPNTPQTLLREHYRCLPKIINFCNQQFYGGKLLVMTEDKGEADVLKAIKTIPGNFCVDHYNQRQIDVIKKEILPKIPKEDLPNIGIISPYFKNQIKEIMVQIPDIDAATVHKYQGREKDIIIISTVDNEISSFADNPNMFNVAISRAKKKLIIILSGNKHPENSNLMALLKYIQYNNFTIEESKVKSIFDFFYTKQTEAKFEILKKTRKISKYDSENMMNSILNEILKEPKYEKFRFVFEMPLKDIVNKRYVNLSSELAEFANKSWSHVDFTIFNSVTKEILFCIEVDGYTYHKQGTVQAQRDEKKNQIFEIMEIPLLRLSTRGSNEEEKIRKQLDNYV